MDKPQSDNATEPMSAALETPQVGYKRPPTKTQFRPGRSGNPKGRPKKSENMSKLLEEVLAERIMVTQGGKHIRMSKAEALVQLTLNQALGGDTKAIEGMLTFADKIGRFKQIEVGQNKPGIVVVPEKCKSHEEWERLYGAAARGEHRRQPAAQPVRAKVTRPITVAGVDQLFRQGEFEHALASYRFHLARCERALEGDKSNMVSQSEFRLVVGRIGAVGAQYIKMGQFAKAIDVFEQVIELAPKALIWPRLRGYALMHEGNVHQAKAIYLDHRGEENWEADVLKDFARGRDIGQTHPLMDEIEQLFSANGEGSASDGDESHD